MIGPLQDALQFVEIVVGVDAHFCSRQPGGIDQAGMSEFVEDDDVGRFEKSLEGAQSSGVSGGEGESGGRAFEVGELLFELVMRGERAAEQARGSEQLPARGSSQS